MADVGAMWLLLLASSLSLVLSLCAKKVLEAIDLMLQPVVYLVCIYIKHAAYIHTCTHKVGNRHTHDWLWK